MANNLKVLLQSNVENLGAGGDVVRVRSGFARNYLLPRRLAILATEGNLKRVAELKRAALALSTKEREAAQAIAQKILTLGTLKIERAVGGEGKMYGSVTSKDIEEAYAKLGAAVDRKRIQLPDPIRQLGSVQVPLKLHAEVAISLSIEVVKKE